MTQNVDMFLHKYKNIDLRNFLILSPSSISFLEMEKMKVNKNVVEI